MRARAALIDAKAAYEADDIPAAIERFTLLAEQGVIEACHYLGFIYETEPGFTDPEQSGLWYGKYLLLLRRAAENGDLGALLSLGKHYQYGDLVGEDSSKARSLFRRAAQAGHADAQFHLATLFLYGWCGCRQDEGQYLEWLDRAAGAQHPDALFKKGTFLRAAGADEQGMALIRRSAELGLGRAGIHGRQLCRSIRVNDEIRECRSIDRPSELGPLLRIHPIHEVSDGRCLIQLCIGLGTLP